MQFILLSVPKIILAAAEAAALGSLLSKYP